MNKEYHILLAKPEHLAALPAIERATADIFPEGIKHLSLTTFNNVPWNAAFYEKKGFRRLSRNKLAATLIAILDKEDELNLKNRVAMQLDFLIFIYHSPGL